MRLGNSHAKNPALRRSTFRSFLTRPLCGASLPGVCRAGALLIAAANCSLSVISDAPAYPQEARARYESSSEDDSSRAQVSSPFRGWDYVVEKLRKDGIPDREIRSVYQNTRFPRFTFVPFALNPRESHAIYEGFTRSSKIEMGAAFCRQHDHTFDQVEKKLKVPREVVASILLVESQYGANTGKEMVVYRLSRLASVGEPGNIARNLMRLREEDPKIKLEDLKRRAVYLEKTFFKELPSLFNIARKNKVNVMNIRGSSAGAFGWPQFLPSAFLAYGYDGNGDGLVSLYNNVDAIWSCANYLASHGYRKELTRQEKEKVIWHYNKSDAYVDAILKLADGIKHRLNH